MNIIKASHTDHQKLTTLTIRSKSYWNYTPAQIKKWRKDLTVSPEYILKNPVYMLYIAQELIGYYSYLAISKRIVKLDNIFIDSIYIRKGYGTLLMQDFISRIKQAGYQKIQLDSDPNAVNFYQHLGFIIIDRIETAIKGRFMPVMELEVQLITSL
ncbi:GNAT family N-acetyltransferase [Aquimarina hainanensis]|uniref:GNAT family N-acetyltransferase n=1 Tax=Aquimarina hainanensis TaxID=1578017 RepID=A0ABW5N236_9FLAO